MAELHDVTHLLLDWRGITHIVAAQKSGWALTLCGAMDTAEVMTEWPLKPRLCRKCRKRLKTAKVLK